MLRRGHWLEINHTELTIRNVALMICIVARRSSIKRLTAICTNFRTFLLSFYKIYGRKISRNFLWSYFSGNFRKNSAWNLNFPTHNLTAAHSVLNLNAVSDIAVIQTKVFLIINETAARTYRMVQKADIAVFFSFKSLLQIHEQRTY